MGLAPQMLQSADTGGTNEWLTPPEVFEPLHEEFRFGLDAAAKDGAERLSNYLSPAIDAFAFDWAEASGREPVFLNSPYGRGLLRWGEKAYVTGLRVPTVHLIFSVTSSKLWHQYVMNASEVRFIEGRVYFIAGEDIYKVKPDGTRVLSLRKGERGPATKDSAIVIYRPEALRNGHPHTSSWRQRK